MSGKTEQLIELGTFGRAQGLRGEIRFWAHNPASPLLQKGRVALVGASKENVTEMIVNRVRRDRKGLFVGFENCQDRTTAEGLTGFKWFQSRASFEMLADDELYIADLIGLSVVSADSQSIGTLVDVIEVGPTFLLLVKMEHREIMVPYVDEFVEHVSLDEGVIKIKVLEGLLETGRG